LFFGVFVLFGLSFLGLFEIVLPSSWVNKVDSKADGQGYGAVFFMALTLALVSFSCTGPIVGAVLVESAGGAIIKPIVGMFGFSLALALPFVMFAIFPQWLSSLPKSGGWLNVVKVVLGFLELALALKYLSTADSVYHWHILDRDIYLALWIVLFSLIGVYLMGKIRLPHDDIVEKLPVGRLVVAIFAFSFVVYMIPGLWGAPLKLLSGYLPPMSTQEFVAGVTNVEKAKDQVGCETPKHADILHAPHGIQAFFDYKQALACAKAQGKPLFVDFTGHGCVNCRKMEENVWSNPDVLKRLKNDFVVVSLYVDERKELPQADWYTSTFDKELKKTVGEQNTDLQITRYATNSQPLYVILDANEKPLAAPKAFDTDVDAYIQFLDDAKMAFSMKDKP
jgi:thiol:disulfide interchange protein DsbD